MFKSLKNNFKKAVSVSAALLLCFGAFAAIPKISVKAETAALYKDEFVSESGVFNTEAEGFPSNYIFDLSGLKKSWTASTSGFYAKVPKKLFQAIRNGGKTVTLVDALGTHHIYRPEDISPKIDTLSSATFNVGTLYRKSKSYADTGNKIAAESGIDINVKLPGKNVPSLDGLSGGEKALIALSIYFAIMRVNAPPFCFLDEVDTALDDINVDRFADYMKKSGFATQFICVTHRRGTMEAADMLYGVTMQEKGITKLIELNVAELEKTLLQNKGA